MSVLVIVASRHGATREIGEVIATTLRGEGANCEVRAPHEVLSAAELGAFDAIVIGSPVYTGRWLPEARDFVEKYAEQLRERQVWLFSSGLADAPANASNRPAETQERLRLVGALGHRHFPGRLDLSVLNFAERAIIAAARGKQGDRRDMLAVGTWARQIATRLESRANV